MRADSVEGQPEMHEVVSEYNAVAASYDVRWKRYIDDSVRATLERIQISPAARVLDVGCGTGALLRQLMHDRPGLHCSGLDASQGMLEQARQHLPKADLREGFADALPWPSAEFDLVASCNAFHFFPDRTQALREMARVLKPDGLLVITDWCDDYLICRACDLYLKLRSPAHRSALGSRACRQLLGDDAWKQVEVDCYKISWLWGLMTATARRAGQQPESSAGNATSRSI